MPGSNSRPNVSEGYEVPTELPGSTGFVPDLFRKSDRQETGGTFPLAVCGSRRAEIGGVLVGEGEYILSGSTSTATRSMQCYVVSG